MHDNTTRLCLYVLEPAPLLCVLSYILCVINEESPHQFSTTLLVKRVQLRKSVSKADDETANHPWRDPPGNS